MILSILRPYVKFAFFLRKQGLCARLVTLCFGTRQNESLKKSCSLCHYGMGNILTPRLCCWCTWFIFLIPSDKCDSVTTEVTADIQTDPWSCMIPCVMINKILVLLYFLFFVQSYLFSMPESQMLLSFYFVCRNSEQVELVSWPCVGHGWSWY